MQDLATLIFLSVIVLVICLVTAVTVFHIISANSQTKHLQEIDKAETRSERRASKSVGNKRKRLWFLRYQ